MALGKQTHEEYLLGLLTEECAEVIQAINKMKRFGHYDFHIKPPTNIESLENEIQDLLAVLYLLDAEGIISTRVNHNKIENKKQKIQKYMTYSRELDMLE